MDPAQPEKAAKCQEGQGRATTGPSSKINEGPARLTGLSAKAVEGPPNPNKVGPARAGNTSLQTPTSFERRASGKLRTGKNASNSSQEWLGTAGTHTQIPMPQIQPTKLTLSRNPYPDMYPYTSTTNPAARTPTHIAQTLTKKGEIKTKPVPGPTNQKLQPGMAKRRQTPKPKHAQCRPYQGNARTAKPKPKRAHLQTVGHPVCVARALRQVTRQNVTRSMGGKAVSYGQPCPWRRGRACDTQAPRNPSTEAVPRTPWLG